MFALCFQRVIAIFRSAKWSVVAPILRDVKGYLPKYSISLLEMRIKPCRMKSMYYLLISNEANKMSTSGIINSREKQSINQKFLSTVL